MYAQDVVIDGNLKSYQRGSMMAKYCYNTFVVQDCKNRKVLLVTSSARKAVAMFQKGRCIEVWNCNLLVERITMKSKDARPMQIYIEAEKKYIGDKQSKRSKRGWGNACRETKKRV